MKNTPCRPFCWVSSTAEDLDIRSAMDPFADEVSRDLDESADAAVEAFAPRSGTGGFVRDVLYLERLG